MKFIIDPKSFNKYSIFSNEGKTLLKKYIKQVQSGGSEEPDNDVDSMSEEPDNDVSIHSLYNITTIGLHQFANFKLNILLLGEYHTKINKKTIGGPTLKQKHIDNIVNYVKYIVSGMNKKHNNCCINFYAELDIPEEQNLLKKYEQYHDSTYTHKNMQIHGQGVLGQLTQYMYNQSKENTNVKAISFDLRRSNLYVGLFVFMVEMEKNKISNMFENTDILDGFGCYFLVKYYQQLVESFKGTQTNEQIVRQFTEDIKQLTTSQITGRLLDVYNWFFNNEAFNRLINIYYKLIEYFLINDGEAEQFFLGYKLIELIWYAMTDSDKTGIPDDIIIPISNKAYTSRKVFLTNKQENIQEHSEIKNRLKDIILTYYMEVSSRILKEYYKCAYPDIQKRISPDKVVGHLEHKYLWMTDMYAFYRFFMKPKESDAGYCKLQKNIILHGGDAHIKNLHMLIKNTFNNPYELSIKMLRHNGTTLYNPLYTLNIIVSGAYIKPKHKTQISQLLNNSFKRPSNKEEIFHKDDKYMLILKDDDVVGCFYFTTFQSVIYRNLIFGLREMPSLTSNDDIYIYNLAIDLKERGKKLCNYLISCGLCLLHKTYPNRNKLLLAENPNYHNASASAAAAAANACYKKVMRLEPNCQNDTKNRFCYYFKDKNTDPVTPSLPNIEIEQMGNAPNKKWGEIVTYIANEMKATCENSEYNVVNCNISPEKYEEGGATKTTKSLI